VRSSKKMLGKNWGCSMSLMLVDSTFEGDILTVA
jgi:hypothetical protein